MIKTTYQTPEIRNSNDEIVQEGAFGKNTALSNSTNDGWIDYVMNDLEALHDSIGDSAATLDGNGHVVEPANLAIGDEDGVRLKTGYLKLTGGTVAGTLNVQQNLKIQDNQENVFGGFTVPASTASAQYLLIYGGENTAAGNANMVLFPQGDGRFQLTAYSNDGANTYRLVTDDSGNLNWRGYSLAWKKDYLPLTGGVLNGYLQFSGQDARIISNRSDRDGGVSIYGGGGYSTGSYAAFYGVNHASYAGRFVIRAVTDGSNYKELQGRPDGTLTWGGQSIALAPNVLALSGGTLSGNSAKITMGNGASFISSYSTGMVMCGDADTSNASQFVLYTKANGNGFVLDAGDGTTRKRLEGKPDGTLKWNDNDLTPQKETGYYPNAISVPNNTITEITSFTITKGTWLCLYMGEFASNATGYRNLAISTSSTGSATNRFAAVQMQAANGMATRIQGTTILRVGSNTTYYLNARQNSGSALNVTGAVNVFRLSTVS